MLEFSIPVCRVGHGEHVVQKKLEKYLFCLEFLILKVGQKVILIPGLIR